MRKITFHTFRGTKLVGEIEEERKTKYGKIAFIRMLGLVYAVLNGTSVNETQENEAGDSWRAETCRWIELNKL